MQSPTGVHTHGPAELVTTCMCACTYVCKVCMCRVLSAVCRLPAPPEQPQSDGQPPHLSPPARGEAGHQGRAGLPQVKVAGGGGGRSRWELGRESVGARNELCWSKTSSIRVMDLVISDSAGDGRGRCSELQCIPPSKTQVGKSL